MKLLQPESQFKNDLFSRGLIPNKFLMQSLKKKKKFFFLLELLAQAVTSQSTVQGHISLRPSSLLWQLLAFRTLPKGWPSALTSLE